MSSLRFGISALKANPLFCSIMSSLHDGVLIADHEGYVKYVNSSYSRITGATSENVLNKKVEEVRKGARLPEVLRTGKELLGLRRKVNQIEYIADIYPICLDNKVIGAVSIVRDITEIVELSQKLKDYSHRVVRLHNKVREINRARYGFDNIIGRSQEIERTKRIAERAAASSAPVLIMGESGSGKELFAHAIHTASQRKDDPFVPVNCAAFSPQLLSSELFGYEEGAFTGALKGGKLGLFEIANGGTLFLDEIGDMDLELQSKLLRTLGSGEFMRIGGTKPVKVDVRIISATNQDLEGLIRQKKYRVELFYRLNVIALNIPPLRNHLGDLPLLVEHCLERLGRRQGKRYAASAATLTILSKYHYPGNVRELFNILEFAASMCETQEIMPTDLPIFPRIQHQLSHTGLLSDTVKNSEKDMIAEALQNFGMSVQGKREAARHLGISLATLYNRIRQYNF